MILGKNDVVISLFSAIYIYCNIENEIISIGLNVKIMVRIYKIFPDSSDHTCQ